ncbi:MAG TPA: hypothetical protein VI248_23650 [Kineosporiaceae bacterium]
MEVRQGVFLTAGERVLWRVHDPARAVIVDLTRHRYARLIIEVPDPDVTAAAIQHAVRAQPR